MTTTADADLVKAMASAVAGDGIAFGRIVAACEGETHRACLAIGRREQSVRGAVGGRVPDRGS